MDILDRIVNARIFKNRYMMAAFVILIALYPLRWTFTGADMWDVGYNCGNFIHFDRNILGDTWFFSTFLAGALGHFISLLPLGHTLAGMRFYCSLVITCNVIVSSIFCINKLRIRPGIVIIGSILAVSLCYSPSVVLYNHLSFLLLDIAVILLYTGLTEDRCYCLALSGFLLGLNVFVRFSNITQAVLIVGVIYYLAISRKGFKDSLVRILLCICGYIAALLIMFVILSQYGISDYFSGIHGLFTMTEDAVEYKPGAMLLRMFDIYVRGGRRIADIVLFSTAAFLVILLFGKLRKKERILSLVTGGLLIVFFVLKGLMQFDFHHYITVILTAAMFIDLVLLLFIAIIAGRKYGTDDKLIAALMLLFIMSLSVGSNTAISPIMNSLFIIGPLMADKATLYICDKKSLYFSILTRVAFVAVAAFYIQCVLFGAMYSYQEAQNGAGGRMTVTGNPVLCGVRMDDDHARNLQELTDHIGRNGLSGVGLITYGYAPSLAFYLELEPVITTWPDLESYSLSSMKKDIQALEAAIDIHNMECPVIIIDNEGALKQKEKDPQKWELLSGFIKAYSYSPDYDNGRFTVYTANR